MMADWEKKISIAVIDSGINTSVDDLNNYVSKSTAYRINSEGFISEFPEIQPNGIHGTSVALIIRDICKNVEIISLNILNENLSTDSRVMIYAMNEAVKFEPDIIHLSLGTTRWKYRSYIKEIVSIATEKNIIIVAACNNLGFRSYPACLKGVVGVKFTKKRNRSKYYYYKRMKYYYAPFSMNDIEGVDKLKGWRKMNGTSVAAAFITGHIAKIKSKENQKKKSDVINSLINGIK
ncbi:MAG: subtilase [Bacteroidales bacterium]|nr:MAG: subtilase [Bacteroidales bacterium]